MGLGTVLRGEADLASWIALMTVQGARQPTAGSATTAACGASDRVLSKHLEPGALPLGEAQGQPSVADHSLGDGRRLLPHGHPRAALPPPSHSCGRSVPRTFGCQRPERAPQRGPRRYAADRDREVEGFGPRRRYPRWGPRSSPLDVQTASFQSPGNTPKKLDSIRTPF